MESHKLLSLNISLGTYSSFLEKLLLLSKQKSSYTCFANVHMLIEAYNNPRFSEVVNNADLTAADGMPIAKALDILYGIKQDRIAGMDVLPDLLKISERDNISVYFYGGTENMLKTTVSYCSANYPNLNIVGTFSPPFRELTFDEEIEIINLINSCNPGFLFVALGCPKQEIWMSKMKDRIESCMLGIGGALPVMIGMQKRAPKWMQKSSLEWLFRFSQEPKRLFKRYVMTNSLFMTLIFKSFVKQRILRKP